MKAVAYGASNAMLLFRVQHRTNCDIEDAKQLVANGCMAVCEGANMPTTEEATKYLQDNKRIICSG